MSNEIVSSMIIASATILSSIILGIVAKKISLNISKIKENNRKLLEDWESFYKIEDLLLNEILEIKGTPVHCIPSVSYILPMKAASVSFAGK